LYVVATPIGNLEDVTLRAVRVLRDVRLIAAEDTRRTGRLLSHLGIDTPMTSLHAHNERDRLPHLLDLLASGHGVALVTDAGTPILSDPGALLVRSVLDAGYAVEPIPGPSAITAALTMVGEGARGFTFEGFAPTKSHDRTKWFLRVASYDHPVVFFEAPHRIARTLEELGALTGPARPVAVCREMTKLHEQLIRGPIAEVAAHADVLQPQGEFTVVLLPADEPVVDAAVTDEAVWREFCSLTENEGLRRREAVTLAARRLGVATREAYAALERHKAVRALAHQS
jgi:16S rRNA (cytidine1402-2'-O)-methyltransferase